MKSLVKYTSFLFLFWFTVFFFNRLFFVLYQMPITGKIKIQSDFYKSFIEGYQLDISTSTILILLPLAFGISYYIFEHSVLKRMAGGLITVLLLVYIITSIGDAGLYKEWNAKINMQALTHFNNPSEVFRIVSTKLILLFVVITSCFFVPFYWLYTRKLHPVLKTDTETVFKKRLWKGIVFFLLSVGLGVILIRGGLTNIPINQSVAYFSNDVFANDIAVNPLYNIMQDATIKSTIPETSLYKFRSNEDARSLIMADYTVTNDSTISIINTTRPNLVFIFLESWSADNVSVLGGIEGCTPQFNALSKEGLLFTQAYSNAYVSDQGIPAVLSAYPSVSRVAVINQPSKVPALHCLSEDLAPLGYSRSFMFGGDLVYGNLRGYLLEKKFTELIEQKDLTQFPQGRLGVHDEYTYPALLKNLNQKKEPFFQGFFTTSSHMPYDYTASDAWKSPKGDQERPYTEAVHYSDLHMGKFFAEAKKQAWYKNTLFVVVADHSHNTIKQWNPASAMHAHIPLLMLGGALKDEWKGKTWDKIVSQLDIASGILHQMEIPSDHYVWSRNLFNPYTPSSAYYVFFGGAGYINDVGYAASHQGDAKNIATNCIQSNLIMPLHNKAMSFQQLVYEEVGKKP